MSNPPIKFKAGTNIRSGEEVVLDRTSGMLFPLGYDKTPEVGMECRLNHDFILERYHGFYMGMRIVHVEGDRRVCQFTGKEWIVVKLNEPERFYGRKFYDRPIQDVQLP